VSVVGPVYCEEQTIGVFHDRLVAALEGIEPAVIFEVIYVNDGSSDGSLARLREIAAADERVRVVDLSRNFGHQLAITAGLDDARGDAVVVIDTDLQDPPEVIASLVGRWRDGFDVVYGVRATREGDSYFKRFTANLFYRLINWLSDTPLPHDAGDFRLMDRAVHGVLKQMREENRYVRGMVSWIGFDQTAVTFERDARYAGTTGYPLRRMLRLAMDAVTSFSERPLKLASRVGALVVLLSLAYIAVTVIVKIVHPAYLIPGYASMLAVIVFFGGIQLLCLGLLGEYVGRIFRETKRRPLYVVRERIAHEPERSE
jgi:glycosyltransferase involved in cell wall biosynthesis